MRPRRGSGERMLALAGVLAVVIAACGGADDTGPSTSSATGTTLAVEEGTTVGPDGGTLTSDDGMFTVEIPPGALSSELAMAITMVTPSEAGLDPTFLAGPIYGLLPDGTTFDAPVTTTRLLSADDLELAAGVVPFFHVFQGSGAEWVPVSTETSRDGDNVMVLAEIGHFSDNVAVATTNVWGFGLEARVELDPGSFEAPVESTVQVDWSVAPPGDLDLRETSAELSHTGALRSFVVDHGPFMLAECGSSPGAGTYSVRLDGTVGLPWDYEDLGETPTDAFFTWFFGAPPSSGEPFTVSVTGEAECIEVDATGDPSAQSSSLSPGSFVGTFNFDPVGSGGSYADTFLLTILPRESVEAVLADEGISLIGQVRDALESTEAEVVEDFAIVLSQGDLDSVGQVTFGVPIDTGDGAFRFITANVTETYSEFYVIQIVFCAGFPEECQDLGADVVTFGGTPDTDVESTVADIWNRIDSLEGVSGAYTYIYTAEDSMTRESN